MSGSLYGHNVVCMCSYGCLCLSVCNEVHVVIKYKVLTYHYVATPSSNAIVRDLHT